MRLAAAAQAKIIIADLRLTPEAEAITQGSEDIIFVPCDVAKWADLEALIQVSREKFNDVPDAYVAGAGVFEPVYNTLPTL